MKNILYDSVITRSGVGQSSLFDDPDIILKSVNYDYSILRNLLTDAHVYATVQQRKMYVTKMEYVIENVRNKLIEERIKSVLDSLNIPAITSDMIDAVLFGFSVLEIIWRKKDNEILPFSVTGRPQEYFTFDPENNLRIKSLNLTGGISNFGKGEPIPDNKFILIQHQPSFNNPYGEKLLSRCYMPVTFKQSGIKYWQLMMERFGNPYLIGRYPITATREERETLLSDLEKMVQDSISVFADGTQIEMIDTTKHDIGSVFESLVKFHNKEISKAILSVTLTTEMESVGAYKVAQIHKEMLESICETDKRLAEMGLTTLVNYYLNLNFPDKENPKITLRQYEETEAFSIDRDKKLQEMGVVFSKEYYCKRYGLSEREFEIVKSENLKSKSTMNNE